MDGTDNFTTRYLINDACVKLGKPWIYCGVIAAYGMTMTIRPHHSPCLRCIMGDLPAPGTVPTCDIAGVIGPIVTLMGSIAAAEAIKLIVGRGTLNAGMIYADLWEDSFDRFDLGDPRPDCPTCGRAEYPFLSAETGARSISLCGRDAVHNLTGLCARSRLGPAASGQGLIQVNLSAEADIEGYDHRLGDGRAIMAHG
jgi:adenylyltransferase/sulfurtransferase